jgi:hypothetical protein
MAILNVPERGQPLDVSTISQIVNAINTLSTSVTNSTYKYVTVDTQGAGKQSVKTSDAKIIGGYVDVVNNSSQNAGDEVSFSYDFSDFKFAPIVTATPVNVTNTPAGKNVSVILKPVTTTKVEGVVKFNTTGEATIGVNLIIVGIPI